MDTYYVICIKPERKYVPERARSTLFYFYYVGKKDKKFSVYKSDAKKYNLLYEAIKDAQGIFKNNPNFEISEEDVEIEFYDNNKLKSIFEI